MTGMALRGIPTEVLVAPDSFKGTFSSVEVAQALGRGLAAGGWDVDLCPVADGGEGTLAVLASPLGLELVTRTVPGPLGEPVEAIYGVGDRLAVIEAAQACGLALIGPEDRDPIAAGTEGVGALISQAAREGASLILVTVGGTATTDGGTGAVQEILASGGLRGGSRLTVLCDVRTVFEDAARVFGPQKGADPQQVEVLTDRLQRLGRSDRGRDPRGVPMTGAGGGLSGGLWSVFGAALVPGAAYVLEALGFDARMRASRAVVTGEGRLDRQSLVGKLVGEVATRARQAGVPCHAVVGRRDLDAFDQRILDLQVVLEASTVDELEQAGRELAGRL
jgi:glycerate kinase